MYKITPSSHFLRKVKKILRKDNSLKKHLEYTLSVLEGNLFNEYLKTHLVIQKNGKKGFSSYVTDDLRVIWKYENKKAKLIGLVDFGDHSGKNKVYQ